MKITKKGFENRRKIVTLIFWKDKQTQKSNMEEKDIRL